MPKADIATISPLLLVIGLVLPALLSESVSKKPLDMFMLGLPLKLIASLLGWLAVQTAFRAYQFEGEPGLAFFIPLVVILVINEIASSLIFASVMSFFARISDPAIGGTYMTLLNTVTNLGSKWPNATALYLLPKLTFSHCVSKSSYYDTSAAGAALRAKLSKIDCTHSTKTCLAKGGKCSIQLDGFTIETAICITIGICWIFMCRDVIAKLQYQPYADWLVINRDRNSKKESK
jgi:MFS transporter, PAT family, solute carrier family 33 (acetyl-CoA transportor), member 1